jgi:sugar (pentulose or hexulose) kinase
MEAGARATVRGAERFEPDPRAVDSYEERYRLYEEVYPALADLLRRV